LLICKRSDKYRSYKIDLHITIIRTRKYNYSFKLQDKPVYNAREINQYIIEEGGLWRQYMTDTLLSCPYTNRLKSKINILWWLT